MTRGEIRFGWTEAIASAQFKLLSEDFWYQNPRGSDALRTAYLRCVDIEALRPNLSAEENVLVCAGGKQAMFLAMRSLVQPGDRVLLPRPGWVPYSIWARDLGARAQYYDASDPEAVELIDQIQSANCDHAVVNSPNNPTGQELSCEAIGRIVEAANLTSTSILSDEVYRHFSRFGGSFLPFVAAASSPIVIVDSLSKWVGAAGLRIGFLIAGSGIIDRALAIRGTIDSCPSGPSQRIATAILSEQFAEARLVITHFVRDRMQSFITLLSSQRVPVMHSGAIYFWIRSRDPFLELDGIGAQKLCGLSGEGFGLPGYARFCPTGITPDHAALLGLEPVQKAGWP